MLEATFAFPFLDELAAAAGRDLLEFQLEILSATQVPVPDEENRPKGPRDLNPEWMKGVLQLMAAVLLFVAKRLGHGSNPLKRRSALST